MYNTTIFKEESFDSTLNFEKTKFLFAWACGKVGEYYTPHGDIFCVPHLVFLVGHSKLIRL